MHEGILLRTLVLSDGHGLIGTDGQPLAPLDPVLLIGVELPDGPLVLLAVEYAQDQERSRQAGESIGKSFFLSKYGYMYEYDVTELLSPE